MDDKKKSIDLKPLSSVRYWGASTSAHQVEGKNHNQWSIWELEHANELAKNAPDKLAHWLPAWGAIESEATQPDNYVSSVAVDFYNRYESDFDILQSLNMNAFRFSIEWSRVEPEPAKWDYTEIDHYRKMIRSLRQRGIEPVVCLFHWTMPVWFFEMGGFENKKNVQYFTRFVGRVIAELKDEINLVITVNEPNVDVGESYVQGLRPGPKSLSKGLKVYLNLMRAHKESYMVIKHLKQSIQVGISQHITHMRPVNKNPITRGIVRARAWGWNWLFFNRTKPYHDYLGLNYYTTDHMKLWKKTNPNQKQNDMGWDMHPYDIRYVIRDGYRKYRKPVMITENGLADRQDQYRQWWLYETLRGISDAISKDSAPVMGYLHWSLLDNFEWTSGYWPRFGLVEVERATLQRRVRDSAAWFGQVLARIRQ